MTIFLNILLMLIGFVLLVKGADFFVDGACAIAEKFGIPQMVIGLTIVAMGTSLPEMAVSISAAIDGSNGIAIGNVLGSNIVNVAFVLGVCALITPLTIQKNTLHFEIPFVIIITAVLIITGTGGGELSRIDGGILLAMFTLFFVYLIYCTISESKMNKIADLDNHVIGAPETEIDSAEIVVLESKGKAVALAILKIVVGGVSVVAGGQFVVATTTTLAEMANVPNSIIGLTIVAIGTSLPELVTSVIAAKKGKVDLAIGNIIGSNIFNILLVLGVSSLISPIAFASSFMIDALVAIGVVIMLFALILVTKTKKLGRVGGAILVATYIGYTLYLVLSTLIKMGMI